MISPARRFLIFHVFAALAVDSDADSDGINVSSTLFSSSVRQLAWAGGKAYSCDSKCREACLGFDPAAPHSWGDARIQRRDVCLAGCGCTGSSDTVLANTEAGVAHVSTDGGKSWVALLDKVRTAMRAGEQFRVEQIHVSHVDPTFVVVLTNTTTQWVSHDGGGNWQALRLSTPAQGEMTVASWQWHPTIKEWAIAESRMPVAKRAEAPSRLAFYTQDSGNSWKLLASSIEQCRWAEQPHNGSHSITLSRHIDGDKSHYLELLSSEDFMATHTVLIGHGAVGGGPQSAKKVIMHLGSMFANVPEAGSDAISHHLQLWISMGSPGGGMGALPGVVATHFRLATWPANVGPMKPRQLRHLRVLHSTESMTLIFLPSTDPSLPWGHVFSYTPGNPELELVLSDVHHVEGLQDGLAIRAVSGIDGMFIANRAILDRGQDLDSIEGQFDGQALEAEEGERAAEEASLGESSVTSPRVVIRTYLSMNMGLAWQPLAAPAQWLAGKPPSRCTKPGLCRLHLAQWTSAASAPGLIVGVGNPGLRLSEDPEHRAVFVSRNAGVDWKQVLEGPHTVAILSHGDTIVAVPAKNPTTLFYSTDTGGQWMSKALTESKATFTVSGFFTHPAHLDYQAMLALSGETVTEATVLTLNASGLLKRSCLLPQEAGEEMSDFEKWSPADAMEDAQTSKRPVCLLGTRTYYIRRKAEKPCQTGLLRLSSLDLRKDEPCLCTKTDWGCDIGFHRTVYTAGANCEAFENTPQPNLSQLCTETTSSHVHLTRGYRRAPGNRCTGGVDLSPKTELCPGNVGLTAAFRRLFSFEANKWRVCVMLCFVVALVAHWCRTRDEGLGHVSNNGSFASAMHRIKKYGVDKKSLSDDEDEEREFLINGKDC